MAYWPGMVELFVDAPDASHYAFYTFTKLDPARHMLAVASLSVYVEYDDIAQARAYISEYVQGGTTYPKPGDPPLELTVLWGTNITEVTFALLGSKSYAKSANVIHFY